MLSDPTSDDVTTQNPLSIALLTFIRQKDSEIVLCWFYVLWATWITSLASAYLRNEFDFWKVHGIMNNSGLLQSKWSPNGFTLTLQETWNIDDSMNIPKIELITYIYILLVKYQFSIFT